MHFPVSISIGNSLFPLHGICETLGIIAAFRYYLYLKRKEGDSIDSYKRLYIIIAATFGAVLGARLVGASENIPEWRTSPEPLFYFWGNKTLVGGLVGGWLAVELIKKIIGEKQNSGDLFVFPLILGMIIGRIGCFSTGVFEETYGFPSGQPWAMDLGDGIKRHPVALYEILFLVMTWIALITLRKKYQIQQGGLFKIFMLSYFSFRFMLDFIKPGWRYFLGLGTIQLVCAAAIIYYITFIVKTPFFMAKKNN